MDFYQHLPEHINPIAFSIGSFNVHWYSLMYLVGFAMVYFLLKYKIHGTKYEIQKKSLILDFLIYAFVGLIAGARLGYVFFYNLTYYIHNPLAIISPFDSAGNYSGIFGMSYFGGLIGITVASSIFCRKNKLNFLEWADFVVPAIPAGFFFGRIGNFLNRELYGKAISHWWGMYFSDGILRHPTQLYEALLEGILLFLILWLLRNKSKFPGYLLLIYLFSYGIIRFFIEFLREPDRGLTLGLTISQILSLAVVMFSIVLFFKISSKRRF